LGVEIPFPIIEDPSMAIGRAYGMIDESSGDSSAVRATYVIDPDGIVRALTWYPMTTGRSVEEMLRLVAALQATDEAGASAPEGWMPGAALLASVPLTQEEARNRGSEKSKEPWYFRKAAK
jgi:peroxiredoxin (alkyl hydroperoxide reductase subunit C)